METKTYTLEDISAKATRLLNDRGRKLFPAKTRKRLEEIYETAHLLIQVWDEYSRRVFPPEQNAIVKRTLKEFPGYLSALHALAEETLAGLSA